MRSDPCFVMPDRRQVGMDQPCMRAYTQLLVKTCHRRGVHAMGGMAAQIPIKNDAGANARAIENVRADKEREVGDGHDGTWVAHPGLVSVATDIFDRRMKRPNQLHRRRFDIEIGAADLLKVPTGKITDAGLRTNITVPLRYLEAWLRGSGCVPIDHLMEDAATAEISRAQLWQWIRHKATLADGTPITPNLVRERINGACESIKKELGDEAYGASRFELAATLFEKISLAPEFPDFLTQLAYDHI